MFHVLCDMFYVTCSIHTGTFQDRHRPSGFALSLYQPPGTLSHGPSATMKAVFGRYVEVCDHENYFCRPCNRWFRSKSAILAHCRSTGAHEWCERCERVFMTEQAKQSHIKLSASHSICSLCDHRPDFATRAQLQEHYDDVHFPCRNGTCKIVFNVYGGLREHLISNHFACEECLRTFDDQNNRDQARCPQPSRRTPD